jgi:TetR/AcrR family transcriptional repressor of nem operon
MFRTGYMGSGIRQIMAEAKAPQGSFTNHFRSKEAFAGEVLAGYFAHTRVLVAQAMDDPTLTPCQRLRRYLDIITERLAGDGFTRGCLIGDLSLEAAPHSEPLRQQLATIYQAWREPFADCIRQAQQDGEVASAFSPEDLADFLLSSWQGAIMRMKVDRNPLALERFKAIAFHTVFRRNNEPESR